MNRLVLDLVALTAIYALALASAAPADLALGAVAAAGVLFALRNLYFRRGVPAIPGLLRRALAVPAFAAVTFRDIVSGTWTVALVVLGRRATGEAGMVAIPVDDYSRTGATVAAVTINLSPGEVVVQIDDDHGVMLIHTIDASDPAGVVARHRRTYERYQQPVIP